MMIELA